MGELRRHGYIGGLLLCAPASALAHVTGTSSSDALAWTWDPFVVACLVLSALLYARGVAALWREAGTARGVHRRQVACFAFGWLALVVALVSPLDALGEHLFSAHMVQHEVLMLVAAPLLVLSAPLATWVWAFPLDSRKAIGRITKSAWVARPWQAITDPFAAWLIHAVALWTWHVPVLFDAALAGNAMHTAQHASFLISALLFWWACLARPSGASLLYLLTTMLHTGALGALLTFSPRLWYAGYVDTAAQFGLTPLEDQQLGGLIMWVPGGLAYLIAALVLLARWLEGRPSAS